MPLPVGDPEPERRPGQGGEADARGGRVVAGGEKPQLSDEELAQVLGVVVAELETCACGDGAGVPQFSPHDLRHRRVSLLHLGGMAWARIGELVGHDYLVTTARTYTHVVADEGELDYAAMLS